MTTAHDDVLAVFEHAVELTMPVHVAAGERWCYLGYIVTHLDRAAGRLSLRSTHTGEALNMAVADVCFAATIDGHVASRTLSPVRESAVDAVQAILSGASVLLADPTLPASARTAIEGAVAHVAGIAM